MAAPPTSAVLLIRTAHVRAAGGGGAGKGRRGAGAARVAAGACPAAVAAAGVLGSPVVTAAVAGVPRLDLRIVARIGARGGTDGGEGAAGSRPDVLAEAGPCAQTRARRSIACLLRLGEGAAGLPAGRKVAIALREELCGGYRGQEGGKKSGDAEVELHRRVPERRSRRERVDGLPLQAAAMVEMRP